MGFTNCSRCGKLFNSIDSPICKECQKELEEKFLQVRDYIRENPTKNMNQVAEDNEVSVRQLQRWVKEEKLCFTKDSGVMIECEQCGKPIQTGRFCKECKGKMTNKLSGLYSEKKAQENGLKSSGAKMHFLN